MGAATCDSGVCLCVQVEGEEEDIGPGPDGLGGDITDTGLDKYERDWFREKRDAYVRSYLLYKHAAKANKNQFVITRSREDAKEAWGKYKDAQETMLPSIQTQQQEQQGGGDSDEGAEREEAEGIELDTREVHELPRLRMDTGAQAAQSLGQRGVRAKRKRNLSKSAHD